MSEKSQNNISNNFSELFHNTTQTNNEKTFTGTKIYDKSNEIDNTSK